MAIITDDYHLIYPMCPHGTYGFAINRKRHMSSDKIRLFDIWSSYAIFNLKHVHLLCDISDSCVQIEYRPYRRKWEKFEYFNKLRFLLGHPSLRKLVLQFMSLRNSYDLRKLTFPNIKISGKVSHEGWLLARCDLLKNLGVKFGSGHQMNQKISCKRLESDKVFGAAFVNLGQVKCPEPVTLLTRNFFKDNLWICILELS